jgi:hypothetical protein
MTPSPPAQPDPFAQRSCRGPVAGIVAKNSTRTASRAGNPSRISKLVVLPAPFGPSSAKISRAAR